MPPAIQRETEKHSRQTRPGFLLRWTAANKAQVGGGT
jgi:hypothetical protein